MPTAQIGRRSAAQPSLSLSIPARDIAANALRCYDVARLQHADALHHDWDSPTWTAIAPLEIKHFMGDEPTHRPRTQAKVAYDPLRLYVHFRVEDQYVRAVARENQQCICRDSCVEFFFTPGADPSAGYFNLEINCGGTYLFHHQPSRQRIGQTPIHPEHCARIQVCHALPQIVDPEIAEPTTWTVAYSIPFDLLAEYAPTSRPSPGVTWRANFYKCADQTSHPHWLTWTPVDQPRPDFHRPESFGTLRFL